MPWRREWQPTPGFLPGESHGQRSLVGYSPWGRTESDMTERLTLYYGSPSWLRQTLLSFLWRSHAPLICCSYSYSQHNSYLYYSFFSICLFILWPCLVAQLVKNLACSAGDLDLIPGSGRSPGEANGNLSSILAWRIPWTEEPDRLQSMELQSATTERLTLTD